MAHEGHWPAIDALASISRSMPDVTSSEHQQSAQRLRRVLAAYRESQDLISIGAYRAGTNPLVDLAVKMAEPIRLFLQQDRDDRANYDSTVAALTQLAAALETGKQGERT